MSRRRADGCPYTHDAASPRLARGLATASTGSPAAAAARLPPASVSTATAPAAAGLVAAAVAPSEAASSPRGLGRTWRGRMGTGTRRGYLGSGRREPDVRSLSANRGNLHRLKRELH